MWEYTILEYNDAEGIKYKMTRRYPAHSIAETKTFTTKEQVKQQLDEWLQ